MDSKSKRSLPEAQRVPVYLSNTYSTQEAQTTPTLHCSYYYGSQHGIVVERVEEEHVYTVQRPVYYISEVLSESKAKYPHVQKLLYALLITSRKLRHYFDEHKVTVVSDFPLGDVLRNRDAIGRISKWSVELRAQNIEFVSYKAIKSQVLLIS